MASYHPCPNTGCVVQIIDGNAIALTPFEAEAVMAGFERMADRLHNTTLAAHFRADVQDLGEALLRLRERAIQSTVAGDAIDALLAQRQLEAMNP